MSETIVVHHAITLTQPWATLMAIGAKRIETRSWKTSFRGWIAIHAAKGFPNDCVDLCLEEPFRTALVAGGIKTPRDLPRGSVLAVALFADCMTTEGCLRSVRGAYGDERAFGDYSEGRYGFLTEGLRLLREPIPMRGALSIWKLPRPITDADLK
jgi:hypothetical protein